MTNAMRLGLIGTGLCVLSCGYPQPNPVGGDGGGGTIDSALTDAGPSAKDITSFKFLVANNPGLATDVTATIDGTTITAKVPLGQALAPLVATFTTNGASVKIGSTTEQSGSTINDFSSSLSYVVTALDGSTQTYTATATARSFATHVDLMVGSNPSAVVLADFNGDGKLDIAVADPGTVDEGSLSVLINTTMTNASLPSFTSDVEIGDQVDGFFGVGDFNADGKLDIAYDSDGRSLGILFNGTAMNGTAATFVAGNKIVPGVGGGIAIADYNADTKPDVAVAASGGSAVEVLLDSTAAGSTTAGFTNPAPFASGQTPGAMVTADFNGDGKPDLATSNSGSVIGASIIFNSTAAGAAAPSFLTNSDINIGSSAGGMAVCDVNGDTKPDLCVVNPTQNMLSVVLNQTAANATTPDFANAVPFTVGTGPVSVAAGDLNGDGKVDLVVTNSTDGTVSVLLNKTTTNSATPSFATKLTFHTGAGPQYVAIGDINGDGFPDLVVSNATDNTVSVLLSD